MREKTFFVYMFWTIAMLGTFHTSYAQPPPTITVTVEVPGASCPAIAPGQNSVTIAPAGGSYTCGAYTIRPKGAGAARVESLGDLNDDKLSFLNARISRSATADPLYIKFTAGNYNDPPTSGAAVDVQYQVSASGFFKKDLTNNLAVDSYVRTRGHIQHPPGDPNPWFMLGSNPPSANGIELQFTVCGTGGCSNYIPTTYHTETQFTTLSSTRILKGEFWVSLNASNEALHIDSLQVRNTAGSRPCDPEAEEDCPPLCHPKECVRKKKPSVPTGVRDWICENLGFFCVSD